MAKRGFFRRITDRVTATVDKVTDTIAAPFKKKEAPAKKSSRKTGKKQTPKSPARKVHPPKPAPPLHKQKPSPAVAREKLMEKLQDMYWLQRKWDAAAMSKRINKMTDAQVYAALDMSENDIETAARANPRSQPEYAAPDDPNSNILWYHGGESMIV